MMTKLAHGQVWKARNGALVTLTHKRSVTDDPEHPGTEYEWLTGYPGSYVYDNANEMGKRVFGELDHSLDLIELVEVQ